MIYRLPNGVEYEVLNSLHVVTRFPDGVSAPGDAHLRKEDASRARSLGYEGTDLDVIYQMHRDHDLLHSIVALSIDGGESHALRYASRGVQEPGRIPMEERLVFALTRAVNQGRAILEQYRVDDEVAA